MRLAGKPVILKRPICHLSNSVSGLKKHGPLENFAGSLPNPFSSVEGNIVIASAHPGCDLCNVTKRPRMFIGSQRHVFRRPVMPNPAMGRNSKLQHLGKLLE